MRREQRHYKKQKSPRRQLITSQLDEHSHRIKELLRADLNLLEEENAILKAKCKKVGELQNKVQMVLRQNSQLLCQNEKISKLLHEKKSDFQIMKNKFDSTMAHRMQVTAENQFERKKLYNQIEHLKSGINEVEHSKNIQINDAKNQCSYEIQNLKRQHSSTLQSFEQEIRKLREQLEKKDYETVDQNNKFKRVSSENEYEILRLKEEKQKLRNELMYLDTDHQRDLESIKIKIQSNFQDEVESLKRNHALNTENLQTENQRLKDYLNNRSYEIEELNSKIGKQKQHFEETISLLRKENESIRMKMHEGERYNETQIDNLKIKLHQMHEMQNQELKVNHQKYADCLQGQILKLQNNIKNKNDEIEQLIKEKASIKQLLNSEGSRLREEIDSLQFKIKDLQAQLKLNQERSELKLRQKDEHIRFLEQTHAISEANAEKDIQNLRNMVNMKENELENERMANQERQQNLKDSLSETKNQLDDLKTQYKKQKEEHGNEFEDLKNQFEGTIIQLNTRIETLKSQNNILQKQIDSLNKNLESKEKEIKSLKERIKGIEDRQKKLQKENEDLRLKLVKKDQKMNQNLAEQKQRLQSSFAYTLQNLKADHENAVQLSQSKIADANQAVKKKEKELDDLLRTYKKMRSQMEALSQEEANKKEMTLKYPGATADLIATKNLFDVYLKSKVIDLCGEEQEKENKA